jgi:hypothetical protein
MAPPVVNSEDPDGTESDRENETEPVPVASETPLIDSSQAAQTSTEIIPSATDTTISNLETQNISVSEALAAESIHPWDGPPAKEPVYPPGTFRGMF